MKSPIRLFSRTILLGSMFACATLVPSMSVAGEKLQSPDGKLAVEFKINPDGVPIYLIQQNAATVLPESKLGLVRDDEDFSKGLTLKNESAVKSVEDKYEILTAKRRMNTYKANQKTFSLATASGKKMDIVFQVSNDGVAFRYSFPETSAEVRSIKEEKTTFHFAPETKGFLQPMQVAKTGYEKSNPAYEDGYRRDIAVGTPSPAKVGWVFPALFHKGDTWFLVSETGLGRGYCASRLRSDSPNGEYQIGFPDPRETMNGAPVNPSSKLPWVTPWRLIVVGSLKTVTESTLGTDLAEPAKGPIPATARPGKAAWSWPLLGDGSANFNTQKQFIDYAADMNWGYCLIDALWDKQIGYDKMKELADYAKTKNVGLLLWYNSAGDWNTVKQTPRDKFLTHESRIAEFDRLKGMGIKGLKVDFFGGDGQAVINYYLDILEDSAPYGLLMNFHGATLPRGWERTYPHLMTVEAIRGLEYMTFDQNIANDEPVHAAMLPFTRNVFDPMDFTPVVLDRLQGKSQLASTAGFQLAEAVLFISGIQHYGEIPKGMAKQPDYVKDFMKKVPSIWEDCKFIDGYPGKFVVLARKGDKRWYVAGINAEAEEKKLSLDLSALSVKGGTMITDGDGTEKYKQAPVTVGKAVEVTVKSKGGFVMVLE